ncbi:MAG TPA: hypothetical protein VFV11_06740 [Solimonas sp.]|nr:hypothetical protein [Solimonas sp.]
MKPSLLTKLQTLAERRVVACLGLASRPGERPRRFVVGGFPSGRSGDEH